MNRRVYEEIIDCRRCYLKSSFVWAIAILSTIFSASTGFTNAPADIKRVVLLNALDNFGLLEAVKFAKSVKADCLKTILFARNEDFVKTSEAIKRDIASYASELKLYNSKPLIDRAVGRKENPVEKVTLILESFFIVSNLQSKLNTSAATLNLPPTHVVSIAFQGKTVPVATSNFLNIFKRIQNGTSGMDTSHHSNLHHLILLGKTRQMTSPSNWHDLLLVAWDASSLPARSWLTTFRDVFFHHATNRQAFTLLDPRPAMLEATLQHPEVNIGYFSKWDTCSLIANTPELPGAITASNAVPIIQCNDLKSSYHSHMAKNKTGTSFTNSSYFQFHKTRHGNNNNNLHPFAESRCMGINDGIASVEIYCNQETIKERASFSDRFRLEDDCLILDLPNQWKHRIGRDVHNSIRFNAYKDGFEEDLIQGALRFRKTNELNKPKDFCWATG